MGLAQGLMVAVTPEQFEVTTVGDDVIHHRGSGRVPRLQAHHAQGMLSKERCPELLPAVVVQAHRLALSANRLSSSYLAAMA